MEEEENKCRGPSEMGFVVSFGGRILGNADARGTFSVYFLPLILLLPILLLLLLLILLLLLM